MQDQPTDLPTSTSAGYKSAAAFPASIVAPSGTQLRYPNE